MAIYVLFQCCKCNSKKRIHLYSFTKNKYDVYYSLCEHFNVRYSFKCKFGFFNLGWYIILEVKVQCKNCNNKYYKFNDITFNSDYYQYANRHSCCYNVFSFTVDGYKYVSDGEGLLAQAKQKEEEENFKKQQEMRKKQEERMKKEFEEHLKIQLKQQQEKNKWELE